MSKDNFETRVSANFGCRTIESADGEVAENFSSLVVVSDAVFAEIAIGDNSVIDTGNKFSITSSEIPAGAIFTAPQGQAFTSVQLTSGMVIGYYAAQ